MLEEIHLILTSSRRQSGKHIIIDKHVTELISASYDSGIISFRSTFETTYDNHHQLSLGGNVCSAGRAVQTFVS